MTNLLLRLFVKDYKNTEDITVRKKYGLLGSLFGLITNLILFLAKIVIGVIRHRTSILADAINNLSDFGNNFLSIFGFKVSAKKADKEHPFGHQRREYVISLIISCVIIALGVVMGYQGINDGIVFFKSIVSTGKPTLDQTFLSADGSKNVVKFAVTLSILALAILIKLSQSLLYRSLGKKINSLQLEALSKDSRNDRISTLLVIVGVIITWFTSYNVDCFFTLTVAVLVIISGIGIRKTATELLIGEAPSKEVIRTMSNRILAHKGVLGVHDLTRHCYGKVVFAVIHVEVDASIPIRKSHERIDDIEREIQKTMDIQLTIHRDPIRVHDPETDLYHQAVLEALKKYGHSIHRHDFRLVTADKFVNLVFDVVMPNDIDDENGRNSLIKYLEKEIDGKFGKKTYFVINFDDSIQDFLSNAQENEK